MAQRAVLEAVIDPQGAVTGGAAASRAMDQMRASARQAVQQVDQLTLASDTSARAASRQAAEIVRLGSAAQQASGRMSQFGRVAQQAGFQIGDVATQIAMGGNAMQAMAVQGSQLISMFGGPWGAAIGAAVAIAGALAATLFDVGKKSREAGHAAEDYAERLESARKLMAEIEGLGKTRTQTLREEREALLAAGAAEVERAQVAVEAQRALLAASQLADPETAMAVGGAAGLRIAELTRDLDAAAKRLAELRDTFAGSEAKLIQQEGRAAREAAAREDERLQRDLAREQLRIAKLMQDDWTRTAERGARERLQIEEYGAEELRRLQAEQLREVEKTAQERARAQERAAQLALQRSREVVAASESIADSLIDNFRRAKDEGESLFKRMADSILATLEDLAFAMAKQVLVVPITPGLMSVTGRKR